MCVCLYIYKYTHMNEWMNEWMHEMNEKNECICT